MAPPRPARTEARVGTEPTRQDASDTTVGHSMSLRVVVSWCRVFDSAADPLLTQPQLTATDRVSE